MNTPALEDLWVNPDWSKLPLFDRTGWKRVRFGDMVENLNETCVPAEAGIERFIGLEHLEPSSLHIRTWGNVADGTTFTRRARPGQVLFGKRRAYQKKVAVAEFNAVVSGDIYVLAPKGDRLLPGLLPFLCQSDRFFNHAVGTSAGSLSPRTNWTSLASFEFEIPPLDQQQRLVELIAAMDTLEHKQIEETRRSIAYRNAVIEESLRKFSAGSSHRLDSLWLQSPDSGCSAPPSSTETGHFVLSLTALSEHGYLRGNLKPVKPSSEMLGARLKIGDFLISRSNTQELVGFVGIFDEGRIDVSFPDTMMRLHIDERLVDRLYLELVLLSGLGRRHMARSAAGTSGSMKKINRQTLGSCMIPTPSIVKQKGLVEQADSCRQLVSVLSDAIRRTNVARNALINTVML